MYLPLFSTFILQLGALVIIIDLLLAITDIHLSYRLATSPLGPGTLCVAHIF
jgi:hypothetical protein